VVDFGFDCEASPPAVLWLAYHAVQDGDLTTARALAQEVLSSGDGSLRAQAWGLLGSLAWQEKDTDAAVEKVKAAGGEVRFGPVDIDAGRFAVVTEPNAEPGVFAVIKPAATS